MNLVKKTMGIVVFSLPPAAGLGACTVETAAPVPDSTNPSSGTEKVEDELLHSVQFEGTHRLDFFRMRDGALATREVMSIGQGRFLSDRFTSEPMTMAETFRLAAPNEPVPSKLIEADRRQEESRIAAANRPPNPNFVPPPPKSELTGGPWSSSDLASNEQSLAACSGDLLNDNWGAQWFLDNYCVAGSPWFQQCQVNWGWADNWTAHEKITWGSWPNYHSRMSGFRYRQFEGDFSNYGYGDLFRWRCDALTGWNCFWEQTYANIVVAPRDMFEWHFWQNFDAVYYNDGQNYTRWKARSPCGHLDFAAISDWCVNIHTC